MLANLHHRRRRMSAPAQEQDLTYGVALKYAFGG